jgi:predicted permease
MKSVRRLARRMMSWATAAGDEQILQAEIDDHIGRQTAENIRAGLSPDDARRQALLKFGNVQAVRDSYRDQQGFPAFDALTRDVGHTIRGLRMAPAFTVSTVLTLALGIGATTSIFSLVDAVLLKSLPVADPATLYRLGRESHCCYLGGFSQKDEWSVVSYDLYKHLRDNTNGFAELAAFQDSTPIYGVHRAGDSSTAQVSPGEFVSGNYFTVFGLRAYAGRLLTPSDDLPNAPPVAVMSFRLWQERYASDPGLIGSVFMLDEKPFTIVGISPAGFFGDTLRNAPPDFFLPLNTEPYLDAEADLRLPFQHWLELIGRVQPGAHPRAIEAQMRVNLKRWLQAHWGEMNANDRARFPEQTLYLAPGGAGITSMREQYERWLQILMMASGFVLLVVCANVANLMLVRGLERRRQYSLSRALGAPLARVLRASLAESLVLSLIGGLVGLLIAFGTTRLIVQLAFPTFPGIGAVPIDASPSMPVLLFAFVVSVATGIVFGLAPAWMAARVDPMEVLRGSNRSTSRAGSLSRKSLVVVQTAFSLVLLTTAGVLTASFERLEHQNFGFEQNGRLVANINPRLAGYRADQLSLLYRRIRESIAGIPGVSSVALSLYAPPVAGWGSGVWVDGHPAPSPREDNSSSWNRITPDYLEALAIPVLRGRDISERDAANSPKVAIVNESFARKFFRDENPVGKRFGPRATMSREFEIVGVVKDARYFTTRGLGQPTPAMYFTPEAQADYAQSAGALFLHDIVIAGKPGVNVSSSSVLQAMTSVDANLPVISIRTLREQVAAQFTQPLLIARLTSFFGVLSLLLAVIGLYGVTAFDAGSRTGEIAVRMALGANRRNIVRLVLKGSFALICCGVLIGVPLTLLASQLLTSQLYGASPYDPTVIVAAIMVLVLSVLVASLIPAIRASLSAPMNVLRAE